MGAEKSSAGLKVGHHDGCQHKNDKGHINAELGQVPFEVVLGEDSVEREKDGRKTDENED